MGAVAYPTLKERVILTVRGGEAPADQLSAIVEDVASDGRIGLHVSDAFAHSGAAIRPGSFVSLDCRRDDGLWRMVSLVESVSTSGTVDTGPDLLVSPPHEPRLVDRRRFLRVHANLRVRYVTVDLPPTWEPSGESLRLRGEWEGQIAVAGHSATAFSLGAGGLAASVSAPLPTGAGLYMSIDDPRVAFSTPARVVWHEDAAPGGRDRVGCEFLWLAVEDEDRILSHVVASRHRRHRAPRGPGAVSGA